MMSVRHIARSQTAWQTIAVTGSVVALVACVSEPTLHHEMAGAAGRDTHEEAGDAGAGDRNASTGGASDVAAGGVEEDQHGRAPNVEPEGGSGASDAAVAGRAGADEHPGAQASGGAETGHGGADGSSGADMTAAGGTGAIGGSGGQPGLGTGGEQKATGGGATAGSGGAPSGGASGTTGGTSSSGGVSPSGGASGTTGGASASGGVSPSGGVSTATGGTSSSGGASPSGGSAAGGSISDYDGTWTGLTSQARLVKFTVFSNAVLGAAYDWRLEVPVTEEIVCVASGDITSSFGAPAPIDEFGRFSKGPVANRDVSYTFTGTFTSAVAATGTIDMTRTAPNCTGSALLSFTAEKVVCGDGRIEWPETCDDGNPTPGDGCSQLCQLTPIAEQEPNDDLQSAAEAISDDSVLAGSIDSPTDIDVYAVTNPLAGAIAIKFETHGESMGSCGVDTLLEVYDASGQFLAGDDNGARAWYCSQLTLLVDSGRTVYAVVGSPVGGTIPAYNLFVQYPHS
jgi:cysteine-rich repeat protein